ncbi:thioredoxin family protein [Taibaiella chishuiensis]|uniref:Thioredoxin n=1 Tax=Taibaiella chishuiensis TaxID=1434707 RepID=A0A2P8D9W2_9BACT|nr:thioredoxin family protein [Taibaiella chishuiensis]PSK93987.1 hypothetical protein B0I18_101136 [Taibaiella chishuiensis]
MKRILLLLSLTLGYMSVQAQNKSDYEVIPSENNTEVIYKGQCTFDDIGKVAAFHLQENAAAYKPDAAVTAALKEKLGAYRLTLFLGTWCEDSHYLVPQLYKVLEAAGYPLNTITLYAVDRAKKARNHEEETYAITNVPTLIVSQGDKETGRITESVHKSVEQDLLDIIVKK